MSRAAKIVVIVVCVLIAAIVAALAGMLAFGTSGTPVALASLGAPFRKVDFSDLPQPQKLETSHGSPIAYRVWRENPAASDAELVVIAIHGSSAQSASIHPLGKALSAAGIPVYAPDIRGHGDTGRAATSTMPANSMTTWPTSSPRCAPSSQTRNSF